MHAEGQRSRALIVWWLSHTVANLEFVVSLIEAQDINDQDVSIGHVVVA